MRAATKIPPFQTAPKLRREKGSALAVAMVTLAILAMLAAVTFQTVTSRFRSNYHTASWHDALTSAENGIQYTLVRLRSPLTPNGVLTSPLAVPGSLQSDLAVLSAGGTSVNGTVLTGNNGGTPYPRIQLPTLTIPHVGEGSSQFSAVVTIDGVPSANLTNSGANNWYRIRSVGTVPLSGSANVGIQKYDNFLRKLQFRVDSSGNALSKSQAVRTVEVIAKPVTIGSAALFGVTGVDLNNQNVVINSYDSRSPLYSTNGIYDAAKATANGNVVTDDGLTSGGSIGVINLSPSGAHVYGNIATNNTAVVGNSSNVTGNITQDFYQYLPPAPDPSAVSSSWTNFSAFWSIMSTGTAASPARYKISNNGGDLKLTGSASLSINPPSTGEGYVEIWIPRDLTISGNGGIIIPAHVHVIFYIDGNVQIAGNGIVNTALIPGNVVLYGNHDSTVVQSMTVNGNGQFAGMIYAPSASASVRGGGSSGAMYGSIFANSIFFNGVTNLHYDSAQGDVGAVIDYRIASWYEDNSLTR